MLFHAKEEINYEYVFQTLYNRPSVPWLAHVKSNKGFDPYQAAHNIQKRKR